MTDGVNLQATNKYHTLIKEIQQLSLPRSCQLLVVSKKADSHQIRTLYQVGQKHFGESYWQKAKDKIANLADCDISWHFMGQLQHNKLKMIARYFDWVHSVASLSHMETLAKWHDTTRPLNILLQVNLSGNLSKYGVHPEQLPELIKASQLFPSLTLRGLMLLPEQEDVGSFVALAKLRDSLQQQLKIDLPDLSMGMSQDYSEAIQAGATWVRVGSLLFESN